MSRKRAKTLKRPMLIFSAVIYVALIFVVIYGTHHYVYAGFGAAVPWVIGGIFAVMAVIRLTECVRSFIDYGNTKRYLEERERESRQEREDI